ncbi:MAG: alpha-2-macroglobulin [Nitrospirae bacterium]|nr:MAG: alpha-2-macroglobulin [Nitrospirota bacterium]
MTGLHLLTLLLPAAAADNALIEMFSPEGMVKGIRQATARFSEQAVAFGNPSLADPFAMTCSEKGHGRWADSRTWVYDFDRDLPAGVSCSFSLKPDFKVLSGKPMSGRRTFIFSTGGPNIITHLPGKGEEIDEDQVFVLALDAEPLIGSIEPHTRCSIEGVHETVGVRVFSGKEKEDILGQPNFRHLKELPVVVLQCRQHFPNRSRVTLIWGKGIMTQSGMKTTEDQKLSFRARSAFRASFSCERENAKANCIPILPMRIAFTAPVSWDTARKIVIRGDNKVYRPTISPRHQSPEEAEEESALPGTQSFVQTLTFKGPFPESSSFVLEMPKDLQDDAGRKLSNSKSFPLSVKTDSFPPLAKFPARFGIIELMEHAALPVTLRNLEPEIMTRSLEVAEQTERTTDANKAGQSVKSAGAGRVPPAVQSDPGKENLKRYQEELKGRLRNVGQEKDEKIIDWLKLVASAERTTSILKGAGAVRDFSLPKPGGAKAFEVVGIPLKKPGVYIVEMESRILGASLLKDRKSSLYVPTAALVTNLSAHFKWGRESSLVWVTTLDKAEPVSDAAVSIRDCTGKQIWKGMTGKNGIALIKSGLPAEEDLTSCAGETNYREASPALAGIQRGLFIFARTKDDMTFLHSSWDNGIEPWRYNLPWASDQASARAHTVLDRSLLRAGDTLHMKHIIRRQTSSGFAFPATSDLPQKAVIYHQGSNQHYEFPLKWDKKGTAETTWKIPQESRLGNYMVLLVKNSPDKNRAAGTAEVDGDEYYPPEGWNSANFRVEEFRVPLMKGIIQQSRGPLIQASETDLDLLVSYLSGGGASEMTATLRSQVQPRQIHFDDYDGYTFANGIVEAGLTRTASDHEGDPGGPGGETRSFKMQTMNIKLDSAGSARTTIKGLPGITRPHNLFAELEFRDPNGEVQTVSSRIPLYPSALILGIRPDSWTSSKESFKFSVAALDLDGRPAAGVMVSADLFQKKYYSHRKRLVGGFYAYEHATEIKLAGHLCEGRTDSQGLLICETRSPVSGSVIIQARSEDKDRNPSTVHQEIWIAGKGEWWFDVSDNDRIDLLPEKKRYEPGDTAHFQVRMPFRDATALITVEREGIIDTFVRKISGKDPVIQIPVKGSYAPNVFVSVLCVRGRMAGEKTTALIDLGKPAFKLGISEINVGWRNHELKIQVSTDKAVYRTREKAQVKIAVRTASGGVPPEGSEAAISAVDEGLLELMPNKSWGLLDAMMGRRGYELKTSTAQMQVVGKRHYGLKSQPHGGGGGKQTTRELFDTLLYWKGRVTLDDKGEAFVEVPLNDSLTGFRIAVVAQGSSGLFGTGETSIRTSQDLILFSGLPRIVREGDRFRAGFTARNASVRSMDLEIRGKVSTAGAELDPLSISLQAGQASEFGWDIQVPHGEDSLLFEVAAQEKSGKASDHLKIKQQVRDALPVQTFQATMLQLDNQLRLSVERPSDAVAGKGGLAISFRPRLADGLSGVSRFMKQYPYTCMEQKVSKAIALRDQNLWKSLLGELPAYMDTEGLLKYFPSMRQGSDVLTAYVLSISDEAGWEIPSGLKDRMTEALLNFVSGKLGRYSAVSTADLPLRKLAALEALSRSKKADLKQIRSLSIEPNLWPSSALIDWMSILLRVREIPERDRKLRETEQILRSRLNLQGTTLTLSTERTDNLWWLMVSGDLNAVRVPLLLMNFNLWKEEIPRLIRGTLNRQQRGRWETTTANAWGVLAFEAFSKKYESTVVSGTTSMVLEARERPVDWKDAAGGKSITLGFPKSKADLTIAHHGTGRPWITIQSLAAIPLKGPLSSGYTIRKTLTPVGRSTAGPWSRGDVVRVRLDLEAQADMTWVVLNDPIPAGSHILGSGLGRDSELMTHDEERKGWVWPAFEERTSESFRAYYDYVPKGRWTIEYTVRLNNSGHFQLPPTRVEALYAPEMFGELPNSGMLVVQ